MGRFRKSSVDKGSGSSWPIGLGKNVELKSTLNWEMMRYNLISYKFDATCLVHYNNYTISLMQTVERYTSKIIKAGALLGDTKTMLAHWDQGLSPQENLARFQRENIFGKASRSRVEDILVIFRQRYLENPQVLQSLLILVHETVLAESLDRILFFLSAIRRFLA